MRLKGLLLFSFFLTIAAVPVFAQYEGGDNDGSSVAPLCVTTLDGIDQFSIAAAVLNGSSTFCDFSSESYSVDLTGTSAPQDVQYYWSVPPDATILSSLNSSSITVAFGNTPGTVDVLIVTACSSTTRSMPVTNGVCTMYSGSDNDGFSEVPSCATALDGTPLFTIGAGIVGSVNFCEGATESYSLVVSNMPTNTNYVWTVPAGSFVSSGQGTDVIIVTFGATPGNVSVDVVTDCFITSRSMAVTSMLCPFYGGGDNDGFDSEPSCSTTLDGAPLINVAVGIVGSVGFCEGATESYSMQVDNAPANTYYDWSVPPGSIVTSGQGTNVIIVTFGSTDGNVSVDIITDCFSTSRSLPVSSMSCTFYSGGDNDGFSEAPSCATTLNGGPTFSVTGISGANSFCEFGNESFTAVTVNPPPNTYYLWTVPADATILSGQGTATILVAFGNTNGNVDVTITTDCAVINPATFPVTVTSCSFYAGGDNDGFSTTMNCASLLNGASALIPGPIIGSATFCDFATETYTLNAQGASPETVYQWTVPAGASIISGQGTKTILIQFANTGGTISVDVINLCSTVNVTTSVASVPCIFYSGGNNDGHSVVQQCASNLNGGSSFIPGPITGTASACDFSSEQYSITVAGALASTVYVWSVPAGSTIVSGQGTTSILVAFGNTSGNVSVSVSNECETVNASLPISIANCIFYSGGNNDGFSQTRTCATNLSGGSQFIPGAITGPAAFCNFASDQYSIVVTGANATTTYTWTVPAGASIVSGQGTSSILVSFGNTSGNITVTVANECETVLVPLAVTASNCIFYAGGNSDGFSVTTITNSPLPISLVSFDASVQNNVVYLTWETSSEIDNDFFLIERSKDGKTFEPLTKIDGAGNSKLALKYQARDTNPYHGTSYYRLSQTDFDGSVNYYKVLIVKIETFAEVTRLYPNPVDKDALLHVDFFAEEDGKVKISIVDPAGLSTESEMIDVKAGVNLFEFTPHFKAAGVHVIIIRSNDKAQALRLVVL